MERICWSEAVVDTGSLLLKPYLNGNKPVYLYQTAPPPPPPPASSSPCEYAQPIGGQHGSKYKETSVSTDPCSVSLDISCICIIPCGFTAALL